MVRILPTRLSSCLILCLLPDLQAEEEGEEEEEDFIVVFVRMIQPSVKVVAVVVELAEEETAEDEGLIPVRKETRTFPDSYSEKDLTTWNDTTMKWKI